MDICGCITALCVKEEAHRKVYRRMTTRQMMIIAGGEPELCCRRHTKREGGVYARPYALHVRKSCPECSVHVLCLCRIV